MRKTLYVMPQDTSIFQTQKLEEINALIDDATCLEPEPLRGQRRTD
ncbi:hypothetical protein J0B02_00475 [Enterobacteriaceae bacterium YMB-R22]|nr:hypothetical protein [Tenebrionicola larvae]MBV4411333.1 hypothetical protein [Tenebrionicola larvae]